MEVKILTDEQHKGEILEDKIAGIIYIIISGILMLVGAFIHSNYAFALSIVLFLLSLFFFIDLKSRVIILEMRRLYELSRKKSLPR